MSASDNVIQSLTTISALFADRCFRVPDYQRGYAWEAPQVEALLEDLEVLAESEIGLSLHYTGTLVLVPSAKSAGDQEVFDIVDGQQRLTTLSMLLNILIKKCACDDDDQIPLDDLYQKYISRGVKGINEIPTLKLNSDIEPFFRRLLDDKAEGENIEFLSEKRLKDAYRKMNAWAEENASTTRDARKWIDVVTCGLGLIVYQPQDENEAGMMFEVINNRGKPLTELEKVKNYLIYYAIKKDASKLKDTINEEWGRILKHLALAHQMRDIDNQQLLRSAAIVYFGFRKQESNAAYNKIKEEFSLHDNDLSHAKKLSDFVEFLSRCARYYEALFNYKSRFRDDDLFKGTGIVEQIELIRAQTAHSGILPLFLCLMWLYHNRVINEKALHAKLHLIERVNFRVYMIPVGGVRSDSGHGELFRIAHDLFCRLGGDTSAQLPDHEIEKALAECEFWLKEFAFEYGHRNLDEFKECFRLNPLDTNQDFYKWRGLRYFLVNYEQYLDPSRKINIDLVKQRRDSTSRHNDYFSIEHIYAQSCELAGKEELETARQKRRLGNFMLLEWGVNSSVSNNPIEEKLGHLELNANKEKGTKLAQTGRLFDDFETVFGQKPRDYRKKLKDKTRFRKYKELLNHAEARLIDFAESRWAFDSEKN
ncbi:DUF262 domain-containing protein [Marinobacter sp. BW6]|uniref:DUF262 domain-containing protein n=1 Tax=Marinobacter sp. BW6 TaxID=2592624 RepID=UPI0011DE939C|nr:DUF262 domain-containing protein [Marinobacter sp. BW6]TYC63817.1 DUF262 domain-containing protein [Marinobacter sp. BW6]